MPHALILFCSNTLKTLTHSSAFLCRGASSFANSPSPSIGEKASIGSHIVESEQRYDKSKMILSKSLNMRTGLVHMTSKTREHPKSARGTIPMETCRLESAPRTTKSEKSKLLTDKGKLSSGYYTQTKMLDVSSNGELSKFREIQNQIMTGGMNTTTSIKNQGTSRSANTTKGLQNVRPFNFRQNQNLTSKQSEEKEDLIRSSGKLLNSRGLYEQKLNNVKVGKQVQKLNQPSPKTAIIMEKKPHKWQLSIISGKEAMRNPDVQANRSTTQESNLQRYQNQSLIQQNQSSYNVGETMGKTYLTEEKAGNALKANISAEKIEPLEDVKLETSPSRSMESLSYLKRGGDDNPLKSNISEDKSTKMSQNNKYRYEMYRAEENVSETVKEVNPVQDQTHDYNKRIWSPLYEKKNMDDPASSNYYNNKIKKMHNELIAVSSKSRSRHKIMSKIRVVHAPIVKKGSQLKNTASTRQIKKDHSKSESIVDKKSFTLHDWMPITMPDRNTAYSNLLRQNSRNIDSNKSSESNRKQPFTKWPPIYTKIKTSDKSKTSIIMSKMIPTEHPKRKTVSVSLYRWPPLYSKKKSPDVKSVTPFSHIKPKINLYTKSVEIPVAKKRNETIDIRRPLLC